MTQQSELGNTQLDSASVFGAAYSLWNAVETAAAKIKANLSESYDSTIGLMQEVMRVAEEFERWSCAHINFEDFDDVWPYMLMDKFGRACLAAMNGPASLQEFDEASCLQVALNLKLPIKPESNLPIPVDVRALNPIPNSEFVEFRIQTVRDMREENAIEPFVKGDDPFDPRYSPPYFGLYGVGSDGLLEHISDRDTYADAVALVRNILPYVRFPENPLDELQD